MALPLAQLAAKGAESQVAPMVVVPTGPAGVDLVPAVPPPLPFFGLRRQSTGAPLDVCVGARHLLGLPVVPMILFMTSAGALGPIVPGFGTSVLVLLALSWLVLLATNVYLSYDRLTAVDGNLRWYTQRCSSAIATAARPLAQVVSVKNTGRHVRVAFADGESWLVGEGLGVPAAVRRWLSWRLNELLAARNGAQPSGLQAPSTCL